LITLKFLLVEKNQNVTIASAIFQLLKKLRTEVHSKSLHAVFYKSGECVDKKFKQHNVCLDNEYPQAIGLKYSSLRKV
jgi:hypothetical protein